MLNVNVKEDMCMKRTMFLKEFILKRTTDTKYDCKGGVCHKKI